MKTIQERLRDGADICHARNIQLDYARVVTEAADRIDALEAEVASLTKDAERYRVGREAEYAGLMPTFIRPGKTWADAMDSAYDSAMKEQV